MLDMYLKLIDNQVASDISLIDCDMLSGLGWISKWKYKTKKIESFPWSLWAKK